MGPMQREAVIKTFMTRPEYTIFLVSLKAGGIALNLTEAQAMFSSATRGGTLQLRTKPWTVFID